MQDRLLTLQASAGKKKLMVVHRMCLRRIQEKSIIRISDGGDRIVLLSMIELLVKKFRSPDQEAAHVLLVGLSRIGHVIESEADLG